MPKYSREMEEKIVALFEQGKRNSVISRELSIDRGALPKRRRAWEKRKQEQEKPEAKQEEAIHHKQNDSHPLDPEIYTLMRHQGTKSREVAISQAIETQNAFNPYLLNHGFETPKELVKFFEDEIRIERANVEDMNVDMNINRALHSDRIEEIIALKAEAERQYDVGYDDGEKDFALIVYCTSCGQPITLTPGNETHRRIVKFCREIGIIHSDCVPKYKRIYA